MTLPDVSLAKQSKRKVFFFTPDGVKSGFIKYLGFYKARIHTGQELLNVEIKELFHRS